MTGDIGTFRILVVDDEKKIESIVRENLVQYGSQVAVSAASTADEASACLRDQYFDLILLDLYRERDQSGRMIRDQFGVEVYRRTDALGLSTRVMFMTRFSLREDTARLLRLMSSESSWRIAGFLDKTANFGAAVKGQVGREIDRFLAHRAAIVGIDTVATQIFKQRYRYKGHDGAISLRKSALEVAAEIDRLLCDLFVSLPGSAARKSQVAVQLTPMERRGLSAAVVVNATVSVTLDGLDTGSTGHQTVLKIGPKVEILEEAARFMEYVRYGVELAQRVELLGVARADALGGLVYSFAGGVDYDLVSLDEVLVDDLTSGNLVLSTKILRSLFSTRNWYSVTAAPMDLGEYFGNTYRTDLNRSWREGAGHLLDLDGKFEGGLIVRRLEESRDGIGITIQASGGTTVGIPDASVLGWAPLLDNAKSCLVHGDMHGGNVLLETSRDDQAGAGLARRHHRTCLIDFRNSGPGPRCVDAVCLEASIRLAEAEVLAQSPEHKEGLLGRGNASNVVDEVLTRLEDEKKLYKAVFNGEGEPPDSGWARLCATVLQELISCFEDVSLQEYLATSVRYTIRGLGFPLKDISRIRIVTWLGAQFELAREFEDNV
jgi:CheY-like chemotaxis protein